MDNATSKQKTKSRNEQRNRKLNINIYKVQIIIYQSIPGRDSCLVAQRRLRSKQADNNMQYYYITNRASS